jgi:hypothetical protein
MVQTFDSRWANGWAARVSIPAPWESSQIVRLRPSLSAYWSETPVDSPMSADVLSNLLPWLHEWLHGLGSGVVIAVQICRSDDFKIEVRV